MISRKIIAGIILATSTVWSFQAVADGSDNTPIQLALFPPVQLPGTEFGVKGLRLSVVGLNRMVSGLDLAIVGNMTKVQFNGIAIAGLFNWNRGGATITGLQVAGIANFNTYSSKVYGVQIAAFNRAGTVYGLQLGLINIANDLHGIQIGLCNINNAGPFHVSPIVNASF